MAKTRVGRIVATKPNWANDVEATFSYSTGMVEALYGQEQRWALREFPRVQLEFLSMLKEDDYQRHQQDFAGVGQDNLYYVACPWRRALLTAPTGSDTAVVDPVPFWVVEGASVILSDNDNEGAAVVASVAGTTITFDEALTESFVAGDEIRPAYVARAQAESDYDAVLAGLRQGAVIWEAEPGEDPHSVVSITPDTFEGRDVFLTKPNWGRAVNINFESGRDLFDPGRGLWKVASPRGFSRTVMKLEYVETSSTRAEELLAFFTRQKGKRGSFFMPTWQVDLRALSAASSGSSGLVVAGEDFYNAYDGSPIWTTLYVGFDDGSYQINRIESMATSGGNTELTMVDTWDQAVAEGAAISWCPRVRFASDVLKLSWPTSEAAETSVAVTVLRNEA